MQLLYKILILNFLIKAVFSQTEQNIVDIEPGQYQSIHPARDGTDEQYVLVLELRFIELLHLEFQLQKKLSTLYELQTDGEPGNHQQLEYPSLSELNQELKENKIQVSVIAPQQDTQIPFILDILDPENGYQQSKQIGINKLIEHYCNDKDFQKCYLRISMEKETRQILDKYGFALIFGSYIQQRNLKGATQIDLNNFKPNFNTKTKIEKVELIELNKDNHDIFLNIVNMKIDLKRGQQNLLSCVGDINTFHFGLVYREYTIEEIQQSQKNFSLFPDIEQKSYQSIPLEDINQKFYLNNQKKRISKVFKCSDSETSSCTFFISLFWLKQIIDKNIMKMFIYLELQNSNEIQPILTHSKLYNIQFSLYQPIIYTFKVKTKDYKLLNVKGCISNENDSLYQQTPCKFAVINNTQKEQEQFYIDFSKKKNYKLQPEENHYLQYINELREVKTEVNEEQLDFDYLVIVNQLDYEQNKPKEIYFQFENYISPKYLPVSQASYNPQYFKFNSETTINKHSYKVAKENFVIELDTVFVYQTSRKNTNQLIITLNHEQFYSQKVKNIQELEDLYIMVKACDKSQKICEIPSENNKDFSFLLKADIIKQKLGHQEGDSKDGEDNPYTTTKNINTSQLTVKNNEEFNIKLPQSLKQSQFIVFYIEKLKYKDIKQQYKYQQGILYDNEDIRYRFYISKLQLTIHESYTNKNFLDNHSKFKHSLILFLTLGAIILAIIIWGARRLRLRKLTRGKGNQFYDNIE